MSRKSSRLEEDVAKINKEKVSMALTSSKGSS